MSRHGLSAAAAARKWIFAAGVQQCLQLWMRHPLPVWISGEVLEWPYITVHSQLSGSNIRLCLPSGEWSGEAAECRVNTCRPMQPPTNGYVSCSTHNYEVDTTCDFG